MSHMSVPAPMRAVPIHASTAARVAIGLLLSAAGGLAFVLAFPPYEVWPLAFLGFVPVLIAQHRVMPPRLSSFASAVGVGVWLQGYLGPVFAPIGTYMVWLPLIVAVATLLTDGGQRGFHSRTGYRWFVLSGTLTWAGIEMIRLFVPIAGTWAYIAHPLYRQTWLIQPASVFGVIGMGMIVMVVNHTLALAAIRWLDARWRIASDATDVPIVVARRSALAGGGLVAGWTALSLALLAVPMDTGQVMVAAVQPRASPIRMANDRSRQAELPALYARMAEQTREAAARGARFIVWPEAAFLGDPQINDRLNLRGLAAETGAHLAVGYAVVTPDGLRNEATVVDPQGRFLGVFGKDHPVVMGGETSLSRGTYPVYDTPLGALGTIICYDLDYTDTTRKLALQGARLIGVPSNDWGSIAASHYTHVVFRAVENRVAMVKADGNWDSAVIDPRGRILALNVSPDGAEATLVADVQLGLGEPTLNARLGDWTGWIGLLGMVFFAAGGRWLERRAWPR